MSRGVFKAELNTFFTKELAEDGYSGVEVRVTPTRTEIIILATKTQQVLGEKGRRIRELTSVVQKRFGFDEDTVEVIFTLFFLLLIHIFFRFYKDLFFLFQSSSTPRRSPLVVSAPLRKLNLSNTSCSVVCLFDGMPFLHFLKTFSA